MTPVGGDEHAQIGMCLHSEMVVGRRAPRPRCRRSTVITDDRASPGACFVAGCRLDRWSRPAYCRVTAGGADSPTQPMDTAALVESWPTVLGWGSGFDAPARPGSSPRPQERPEFGPTDRDRGRETGTSKEPNLAAGLATLLADGQPQRGGATPVGPCHRRKLSSLAGLLTLAVQAPVTPSRSCRVERGVGPAAWRAGLDRCAT
jgi:hypothetical protein